MSHDCIIIGGGIAGLQAAIQMGRYQDSVVVIDAENGRSNLCRCYHNVIGWPDGISGQQLRNIGKRQAEQLGVQFVKDKATKVIKKPADDGFSVETASQQFQGKALLIATGVMDRLPAFDSLLPCLGISAYICPDCDGYEVLDKKVIVIGSGKAGAGMALALTNWTNQIIFINHEREPIPANLQEKLHKKQIVCINKEIEKIETSGEQFKGVYLTDGEMLRANHAFIAMGGNEVRSRLAEQLGVELYKNKHILVDPRTKMTNIENVFAAGDIVAHSEQVTIAMGDGMQAAIWIHKKIKQQH
ncbi:NAD(P)/FAD-dependent oxidoreductase [Sediminibacillus albus]|uniref:Thioredoxin reductase n=1 Tax=Sediminibacillus albus TaxID=407036 RepID=A0A1G8ZY00_9BACI|nr:NAD(P)/FAD-dependent oxidoreductase [Sediminibacillus albus]SDK20019.1 Thioredoxin reductase [Sediminibacillus albus]